MSKQERSVRWYHTDARFLVGAVLVLILIGEISDRIQGHGHCQVELAETTMRLDGRLALELCEAVRDELKSLTVRP